MSEQAGRPEYQFDACSETTELRPARNLFWGTLGRFWRIYVQVGLAAAFVKSINGCYFNVVGLPLHDTLALLTGLGFDLRVRSELIGAPA